MWAVRDVDLSKLHASMPAAMLPCPAPAGADWSFQNPVGVDCSSPEPRCIWLAVLRGAVGSVAPSMAPTRSIRQSQTAHQQRVRTEHQPSAAGCLHLSEPTKQMEIFSNVLSNNDKLASPMNIVLLFLNRCRSLKLHVFFISCGALKMSQGAVVRAESFPGAAAP